jgi:hypothetical protein
MSESAELEPWQQRALEKFQGRGTLQVTGRQAGKSYWTNQAIKRLMDDLNSNPVTDLVLSEGRVYGAKYYCVEPVGGSWIEMEGWCYDVFGNSGHNRIWEDDTKAPTPLQRWYMNNRKFWFRDIKDRDWFVIRWRS